MSWNDHFDNFQYNFIHCSSRNFKEMPGTHGATFPWSLSSWTFKSSSLWKQWISQLKWLTVAPCLLICSQMQIDSSTFYENHRLQSEVAKPASLASLQKAVSLDVNANQACNTGLRAYFCMTVRWGTALQQAASLETFGFLILMSDSFPYFHISTLLGSFTSHFALQMPDRKEHQQLLQRWLCTNTS